MITTGVLAGLVSGIGVIVAIAGGLILGALIMYYLLKDGTRLRRSLVAEVDTAYRDDVDGFIGDACRTLRDYGKGRSIMSAIVAAVVGLAALVLGLPLVFTIMVVNFVGGYIPYIGAFLGGGLAVIVALGDGGVPQAAVMLAWCSPPTCSSRTSWSPRSWGAPSTSTRSSCWSSPRSEACWAASSGSSWPCPPT